MKKYNLVYYWENYLSKQEDICIEPKDYVLKFSLVNGYSNNYFSNWYSFEDTEGVIGFLKYVVIPSAYVTKLFGKEEENVFIDAIDEYEIMELAEESSAINKRELIKKMNKEYDFITRIDKYDFGEDGIKRFVELVEKNNRGNSKIFADVEFYKNVNEIGRSLVEEYEKEDMLDSLEKNMSLSKNQILNMFEHIDQNVFMMKKLNTYLNNTLMF